MLAASRKRSRTQAGGVSKGAALVLPARHLLDLMSAPATWERRIRGRRAALVLFAHRDPHLLDERSLSVRSLHVPSLADRLSGAMGASAHMPSMVAKAAASRTCADGCATSWDDCDRAGGWWLIPTRWMGERVVLREMSAADLGDGVLLDLIRNDDPAGMLSIYVDGTSTATYRGAAIDIDNRLVELERSVEADGSPAVAEALSETLRRIAPVVERLLDPGASGRGRALFASLSHSELTLVSSGIRVSSRVVLDSTAFIHPLLEVIDEGRPAGVVLTSARSADLLDWQLGDMCRISHVRAGPALASGEAPGPVVARQPRATRDADARAAYAARA
jgi:hypothetical protein